MGAVRVNGSTSGYVELAAPAVAGSVVMTLPATTGTVAVQGEAYGRSATATVATSQTTTSTSYTDLATAGPAVTVTTGTKALVSIGVQMGTGTTGGAIAMGFGITGSTTVAAADSFATAIDTCGANFINPGALTMIVTGLTAGSNTFTGKYKTQGATTGTFRFRWITVVDMGS